MLVLEGRINTWPDVFLTHFRYRAVCFACCHPTKGNEMRHIGIFFYVFFFYNLLFSSKSLTFTTAVVAVDGLTSEKAKIANCRDSLRPSVWVEKVAERRRHPTVWQQQESESSCLVEHKQVNNKKKNKRHCSFVSHGLCKHIYNSACLIPFILRPT